jgi:adenylate cyclase
MDDTGPIAPTRPVADGRIATATGRNEAAPAIARALAAAGAPASEAAFERALSAEIVASELIRVRVLFMVLALLLVGEMLLFIFGHDLLEEVTGKPISIWMPLRTMGCFVLYEGLVLYMLGRRAARGRDMPRVIRFVNAAVETSLPTVILWSVSHYVSPEIAFGTWPSTLYFIFIVASTLRLNFVLPTFTGAVAALEYAGLVFAVVPHTAMAMEQLLLYVPPKAAIMLLSGVVAGLVATRLRSKFRQAAEQTALRERVTDLFGQHVSPAVVERLLASPSEFSSETREVCVMFLDIRNFTAQARQHPPEEVVAFLNETFAFMIEAVDRHGGFINKFLGDGFMAMFGAPLADAAAVRHAVEAARDILAEIERRGLDRGAWPLRIGIGLHVGPAVTGNVGSPRRKEFTAIGDTVNLASRLEQLTKEQSACLIVSDAVVDKLGDARGPAAPLGAVAVRGYAEPVPIWRLA